MSEATGTDPVTRNRKPSRRFSTRRQPLDPRLRTALMTLLQWGSILVVWTMAYAIRFDGAIPADHTGRYARGLLIMLVIKTGVFFLRRHHRELWFYASIRGLRELAEGAAISLFVFIVVDRVFFWGRTPSSIPLIDGILTVGLLGGIRVVWRALTESSVVAGIHSNTREPILLVGANHAGARLAHNIGSSREMAYWVRGFLTLHREKIGGRMGGIPILGHVDNVIEVARRCDVTHLLAIAGELTGREMRGLLDRCESAQLHLHIAPRGDAMFCDKAIPLREICIDDLLHRDPIRLDNDIIEELISDRTVLVTGAGGSIGSELCRQILAFHPRKLLLLGRGENRVFFLERELACLRRSVEIVPLIADVANERRMATVFEEQRPEVIFHAAAHKHVPLMEANVTEAVEINILGTKCVADLADQYDVKKFVMISTDKAVNPTSIMGMSKHMAERYVCALSQNSSVSFMVTRFGNVLGSSGSVVPIFKEQIRRGGPITVTDPRMTRYFMTIPEAVQLVLQAAAMGRGGEIFVLDMGSPVRIVDLARDMIRLAGLPEDAIEIQFTGIRPGEKLYEELYFKSEQSRPTPHPKLWAALHRPFDKQEVEEQVDALRRLLNAPEEAIRAGLRRCIPEYQKSLHTESGPSRRPIASV